MEAANSAKQLPAVEAVSHAIEVHVEETAAAAVVVTSHDSGHDDHQNIVIEVSAEDETKTPVVEEPSNTIMPASETKQQDFWTEFLGECQAFVNCTIATSDGVFRYYIFYTYLIDT